MRSGPKTLLTTCILSFGRPKNATHDWYLDGLPRGWTHGRTRYAAAKLVSSARADSGGSLHVENARADGRLNLQVENVRADSRPSLHVENARADGRASLHIESVRADGRASHHVKKT